MKTIILVLSTMLIGTKIFAQQENAAIKEVLQNETTAFFKHDFSKSYSFWHITPESLGVVSESDGQVLYLTSKELNAEYTAKALRDAVFPDRVERSKWLLQVRGNTAYVTFQQTAFKGNSTTGQTYESRYMEKIDGHWKIISMTVVNFKK